MTLFLSIASKALCYVLGRVKASKSFIHSFSSLLVNGSKYSSIASSLCDFIEASFAIFVFSPKRGAVYSTDPFQVAFRVETRG